MIKYTYWKRIIFRIFLRYFFEWYFFLHPVCSLPPQCTQKHSLHRTSNNSFGGVKHSTRFKGYFRWYSSTNRQDSMSAQVFSFPSINLTHRSIPVRRMMLMIASNGPLCKLSLAWREFSTATESRLSVQIRRRRGGQSRDPAWWIANTIATSSRKKMSIFVPAGGGLIG